IRRMPDGSVVYPNQGIPPSHGPPGYKQDPRNPYRWVPVFPDCKYRYIGYNFQERCKCNVPVNKCNALDGVIVSVPFCNSCKIRTGEIAVPENRMTYTDNFPYEVWIAGKGPSLEYFDWSNAGKFRIGINEAVYVVPDCYVACATDQQIMEMYSNNLPESVEYTLLPTTCMYNFGKKIIRWDTEPSYGSGPSALLTAIRKGSKVIHLVGFDSLKGDWRYAKHLNTKAEGMAKNTYRKHIEDVWKIRSKFKGSIIIH